MKRLCSISGLLIALACQVSAAISTNFNSVDLTFANSGYLPDGSLSGWSDTRNLDLTEYAGFTVTDVQVTLNISGGWNGDLYGYLVHGSGFVVLLDRVGSAAPSSFGYGNAGFAGVTLSDAVNLTGSIEDYGTLDSPSAALSGTYNSHGGSLNTSFDTTSVNGNWTLFLADMSAGDISQVTGWTLTIEAVPEPTTWAMMIVGVGFGCWRLKQWRVKQS